MMNPTPRQLDLLRFIKGHLAARGYAPSFVEMAKGIGCTSNSTVARLMDGLEERGLVRRMPAQARSIEVLSDIPIPRAPDGAPLRCVPGFSAQKGAR